MKNTTYYILLIVIALFAGFGLSRCGNGKEVIREVMTTDTLVVYRTDTVHIDRPVPTLVTTADTLYIRDTVTQTVIAQLPVETKLYTDSLYRAQISGVRPNLDFVEVFPRTEYKYIYQTETISQKPKKWGLGVSAGYAFTGSKMQPYIGVGISYDLLQW